MFKKLEVSNDHCRYVEAIQHALLYDSSVENIAFQIMYSLKNLLSRMKGNERDMRVVSEYTELLKEVLWEQAAIRMENIKYRGDLYELNELLVARALDHPNAYAVRKKMSTMIMHSSELISGNSVSVIPSGKLVIETLATGWEYAFSRTNPNLMATLNKESEDDPETIVMLPGRIIVQAI